MGLIKGTVLVENVPKNANRAPTQKQTRYWIENLIPVKYPPKDSNSASFKMAAKNSMEECQKPNEAKIGSSAIKDH